MADGLDAQIKTAVAKRNEEEFRRTWNAAIEAAALVIPKYEDDKMSDIVEAIRRLKK